MDLFEHGSKDQKGHQPLAERLRPQSFEEFLGQNRIQGYSGPFQKLVEAGHLQNLILWGPPGTGKTTFAQLLATKVQAEWIHLNAIESGAKALRETGEQAKVRRVQWGQKTVAFVDEIHRLNKAQQDVFLPYIEKGEFTLVGATTENPSYELNAALLSRCRLLVFHRHEREQLQVLMQKALDSYNVSQEELLSDDAVELLFEIANGDGRRLINLLEPILEIYDLPELRNSEQWPVVPERIEELTGQRVVYYDKSSDAHYDTISAFIKSLRGSDPDAGLYYLARLLKGGEDPVFIARRMVILASEDVSNADPKALPLAVAALQAVELIGLPEAAINLAQVVCYLASAPKSNSSYIGLRKAQAEVDKSGNLPIPLAFRSSKRKEMKELGYGKGYKYAHNGRKGWQEQEFLPPELKGQVFYEPTDHGFEKNIQKYLEWLKN